MSSPERDVTKLGFAKTFVLPALLIFLVPVLSLLFYLHAQAHFDVQSREVLLNSLRQDQRLTAGERDKAIAFVTETPASRLITHEQFAAMFPADARFHYATFRWMIRLSLWSIGAGAGVFLLAGMCVLLSLSSQFVQYWSLLLGWQALRLYGALQTIVQGILLTALWLGRDSDSVLLLLVTGALSVIAAGGVIVAIFRRPPTEFRLEGTVLTRDTAPALWLELDTLCRQLEQAQPPEQVVVGINDAFFVTETPVTVGATTYRGKTLFVSLALLKQLNAGEASAVLAHEMAHFSGQDTLYSHRIAPLLWHYDNYLQTLYKGVTLPVFYFMLCFRALFQLSLSRRQRQREFRADRIAAETTSPRHFAAALLRTVAYSQFRSAVENELFKQERAMASADVSARIERGFPAYAAAFVHNPEIGKLASSHPFDSHPPVVQRLAALGMKLDEQASTLAQPGDGAWRNHIPSAAELERAQWQEFEKRFRDHHEKTLPYRFLPKTPEEQAIVERIFPLVTFTGKEGALTLDFEKVHFASWPDAVLFREILTCQVNDSQVLDIQFERGGKQKRSLKIAKFAKADRQRVLGAFQNYYGRYLAAKQYRELTIR